MKNYADLIKKISEKCGYERGAICGYDLFMGIDSNIKDRAEAWFRYLEETENNEGHTTTVRGGAWVPAISM